MADATSSSPSRSPANAELALPRSDVESQLSSLLYDLSHRVQAAMEDMLKMINEIDQNSSDVMDDIKNCMDFALERKRTLDEEKEHYQKAAYTVISMLNNQFAEG
ncbi:uncharacterized protein [Coffea arabica]|uniref:Polyamine-modulated factor 1-binding protein 1-like n=1 Tax=Coffea arabica TaxID=13443 RepID=A0A6P6TYE2_COFAR|nr:uncharacterized protein LOC113705587 [Coffea arabica]